MNIYLETKNVSINLSIFFHLIYTHVASSRIGISRVWGQR